MIDHISFAVKNYEESIKFYDATLTCLGYERVVTIDQPGVQYAGYGKDGAPKLWIGPIGKDDEAVGSAKGLHMAFLASTVEQVNAWYNACLKNGGQDNGAPGPREIYHPGYYGAFIIDPNGWRIEACLHHFS